MRVLVLLALVAVTTLGGNFTRVAPEVYRWSDTCNVYIVKDANRGLIINCGDGSVIDHMSEIGVEEVEWVLFTDHHREQCQGVGRLKGKGIKFAGPQAERDLFETPLSFRKVNVTLNDRYTVYGSSYVRPPLEPILFERSFGTNDTFVWRGRTIECLDTGGTSPGGMTYVLGNGPEKIGFSGDLILSGARMHTWFDTEWDYGFAAGVKALRESVARVRTKETNLLLPSHGAPIHRPKEELNAYGAKLARLERLYIRGYDPEHGSVAYQDKVSHPTVVSNVWQVSPHLFKFKRLNFWPNFSLILAENGRALLSDCGLLDEGFLDTALEGMREHFGLRGIDAVIVSHMHGDHFLEAQHLREKWGTQIWALENMVDKMEHPEWFDYAAAIQAYGKTNSDGTPLRGVKVDRAFKPGETFKWEGYDFQIDWMPGQTEFALCLHGIIDGRKVAFTGDNIFGDPDDERQTGHEAMVAHNSAVLEEGYIYGAEYLSRLKPDLLMGGHSFVMDHPAAFIDRYRRWSYEMRDTFQALSSEQDYRYWFDPFWLRAQPYRVKVRQGESVGVELHLRNFLTRSLQHSIAVHLDAGLAAEPRALQIELGPESRNSFPIQLSAARQCRTGVHVVGLDVTVDGKRLGERFDVIVEVLPK